MLPFLNCFENILSTAKAMLYYWRLCDKTRDLREHSTVAIVPLQHRGAILYSLWSPYFLSLRSTGKNEIKSSPWALLWERLQHILGIVQTHCSKASISHPLFGHSWLCTSHSFSSFSVECIHLNLRNLPREVAFCHHRRVLSLVWFEDWYILFGTSHRNYPFAYLIQVFKVNNLSSLILHLQCQMHCCPRIHADQMLAEWIKGRCREWMQGPRRTWTRSLTLNTRQRRFPQSCIASAIFIIFQINWRQRNVIIFGEMISSNDYQSLIENNCSVTRFLFLPTFQLPRSLE